MLGDSSLLRYVKVLYYIAYRCHDTEDVVVAIKKMRRRD